MGLEPRIIESPLKTEDFQEPFISFSEFILQKLETHGNKIYLIEAETERKFSFAQLKSDCLKLSSFLHKVGLAPNDVVIVAGFNRYHFMVAFLGVVFAGGTVVPVRGEDTSYELKLEIRRRNAEYLFLDSELKEMASNFKNDVKNIILFGDHIDENFLNLSTILNQNVEKHYVHKHEDITKANLLIMESSGTTGPAKGAIFSHRTFVKILTRNIFFQNRSLITCAYTPIAHGSGLVTFLVSLVEGSIVVSLKRTNVEQLICAIEKYKITSIFLAPYYLTCLTKLDYVPDLSSLQSVVTGASKLSSNIAKTFIKKFSIPEFRQTYGCTEVGFIVTSSHNLCEKFNNTIGKIRPYMKAKIIDPETGKLLGPYQKGEIVATGPSPFDGYHDQPEWTEAIFKDGWVYTGDIGYYDEEENFYIVDRIKDIIKQNSFGFSPSDVEEVLIQHEAVEEAVVVGIPDKEAGEVAHAFIVLKPEISAEAEDLKNFANERLTPGKRIKGEIHFVTSIPKTSIGKSLRRKLREEYFVAQM